MLLVFPYFLDVGVGTIILVKIGDGVGDGFGGRLGDIAGFAVEYDFGEATDVGDDHGFVEVISDLGDAALGGGFVGLYDEIGGGEIVFHVVGGNEIGVNGDSVLQVIVGDEFLVGSLILIKFAGYEEVDVFVGYFC